MDPDGVIVAISYGKCHYEVQVVTALYEGIWSARYNVYGMLEPVELQFEVKTVGKIFMRRNDGRSILRTASRYLKTLEKNCRITDILVNLNIKTAAIRIPYRIVDESLLIHFFLSLCIMIRYNNIVILLLLR